MAPASNDNFALTMTNISAGPASSGDIDPIIVLPKSQPETAMAISPTAVFTGETNN